MIFSVEVEEVELIEPKFDLGKIKTLYRPSPLFEWVGVALDYDETLSTIRTTIPYAPDVVEWMREAAAINAIIDVSSRSYADNGGSLEGRSGDGYIPGVQVRDSYFSSISNAALISRGRATLVTPVGNYDVPVDGKTLVAKGNFLAWAMARRGSEVQWIGTILRWMSLAVASRGSPVSNVSFVNAGGFVAPQFISISPPIGLKHVNYVRLTSNTPQSIRIDLRSPSDYGSVFSSTVVNIPAGTSSLRLRVMGFGSYVLGIHPADGTTTTLDRLEVRRF